MVTLALISLDYARSRLPTQEALRRSRVVLSFSQLYACSSTEELQHGEMQLYS